MNDCARIYDKLTVIEILAERTDSRLQVVIDQQEQHGEDIDKLKTHRSMLAGAYFALVATITALFTVKDRF